MQIIRQKNTAFDSYSKKLDMCYISSVRLTIKIVSKFMTKSVRKNLIILASA